MVETDTGFMQSTNNLRKLFRHIMAGHDFMEFLLLLAFIALTAATVSRSTADPITPGSQVTSRTPKTKVPSLPAESSRIADQTGGLLAAPK